MKIIFFITLYLSLALNVCKGQTPTYDWAISYGNNFSDIATSVATDSEGNSVFIGYFTDSIDFDPDPNIFLYDEGTGDGAFDYFVVKFDPFMDLIWLQVIGGGSADLPHLVEIDQNDDIYIISSHSDTVDVDESGNTAFVYPDSNQGTYLLKLNKNGDFQWVKSFDVDGNAAINYPKAMDFDKDGNILLSGRFKDTIDFDPGPGIFNMISGYEVDDFVLKLDANGDFIWAKQNTGQTAVFSDIVSTDSLGNIYNAGLFNGTIDFDPGSNTHFITSVNSHYNVFLQKLDANGNLLWVHTFSSSTSGSIGVKDVVVTPDEIIMLGGFKGFVDFDPGPVLDTTTASTSNLVNTSYLMKLQHDGTYLSTLILEGVAGMSAVATDNKEIIIGGIFLDTVDFDPGNGVVQGASIGWYDYFLLELDSVNNYMWSYSAGSSGGEELHDMALSVDNSLYIAGAMRFTIDFDPGPDNSNTFSNNSGGLDALLLKFSNCTHSNSITQMNGTLFSDMAAGNHQWLLCDSAFMAISGADAQSYTPVENGNYAVVNSLGSCVDTTSCFTVTDVGIEDHIEYLIQVYPNPASEIIAVTSGVPCDRLELYNGVGKLCAVVNNQNSIDVYDMPQGIYYLKVFVKGQFFSETVVIH